MRTDIRYACALLAVVALSGCFAEVEDKTVVFKQALPDCGDATTGTNQCEFPGVPPIPLHDLGPFTTAGGKAVFTFDLGDQEFLKSKKDLGPMTLENDVKLNNASLVLNKESSDAGASFSWVDVVKFLLLSPGDTTCNPTCLNDGTCREIATYDKTRDGPATDTIVLQGSATNLLDLMSGGQLSICVVAQGALDPPNVPWRADAFLDLSLKAHAGM